MSAHASSWVWDHSPYKGAMFAIHLAIADTAGNEKEFWMRQGKLSVKARVSRQSVSKAINQMVEDGYLEVTEDNSREGMNKPNRYLFLTPQSEQIFDVSSKTGKPGDALKKDDGGPIHEYRKQAQQRRIEETHDSLFGADQTSLLGEPDEADNTADTTEPQDVHEPEPEVVEAEIVVTEEELEERYNNFPLEAVDHDEAGHYAKEAIGYYLDWRKSRGLGDLKIKSWIPQIGSSVKELVKKDIPPRLALEALIAWHDKNTERGLRKEIPIRPGSIITLGVALYEDPQAHGVDRNGTSYKAKRNKQSADILDQLIEQQAAATAAAVN